jgi:hypothetical protein
MPTSIYAAETKKIREFESWREVPDKFKTRNQWLRAGRKVPTKTKPLARLLYPKLVEHWPGSMLENSFLSKVTDDLTLITDPPTPLFHLDQTKPYRASPRTLAYFAFEEIFFDFARKDSYILKFNKEQAQERDSWYTMTAFPTAQNPLDRGFLSPAIIRKHINQREIVGIKATRWTRFVVIDLDFHGRDSKLFEDQAEVLLSEFHGKATWHYQVKRHDVTGLHLIRTFDKPQDLDTITDSLRAILRRLDAGWGKEYLLTWMKDRFPEIKCAKDAKRQRILVALQELGIIEARIKGRPKITATRWVLGERATKAISSQSDAPGTKEHLSLLEFPFSNHEGEEGVIIVKADNKTIVANRSDPETQFQPASKSGGVGSHEMPFDLMESIWERIEPVYAGVGGGLAINEDAA